MIKKTGIAVFWFLSVIGMIDMTLFAFTDGRFKLIRTVLISIFGPQA